MMIPVTGARLQSFAQASALPERAVFGPDRPFRAPPGRKFGACGRPLKIYLTNPAQPTGQAAHHRLYPGSPTGRGHRAPGAQIAQLVEHATENRSVAGSIPALGTIFLLSLAFSLSAV
jgi:hypothetical protein